MSLRSASLLFIDPARAFEQLKKASPGQSLLLLLATILSAAILITFYYQRVDMPWLVAQLTNGMDSSQKESAARVMSRNALTLSGIVGVALLLPLMNTVIALYLFLATKIKGIEVSFSRWFAVAAWSSAPALLALPVGIAVIVLSSDGRIGPDAINSVSFNQLLFHAGPNSPWKALLDNVSVLTLWSVVLCAIGVHKWGGMRLSSALALSSFPYALVYGTWAGIIIVSTP